MSALWEGKKIVSIESNSTMIDQKFQRNIWSETERLKGLVPSTLLPYSSFSSYIYNTHEASVPWKCSKKGVYWSVHPPLWLHRQALTWIRFRLNSLKKVTHFTHHHVPLILCLSFLSWPYLTPFPLENINSLVQLSNP